MKPETHKGSHVWRDPETGPALAGPPQIAGRSDLAACFIVPRIVFPPFATEPTVIKVWEAYDPRTWERTYD